MEPRYVTIYFFDGSTESTGFQDYGGGNDLWIKDGILYIREFSNRVSQYPLSNIKKYLVS
jgi:hypothetical protein